MTVPRRLQIDPEHTRYYHCMSRCVRRAYLCGKDSVSGRNYEHRRGWIEKRLEELSSIFAIDLVAYAIMHNHYHVILRINPRQACSWSDEEIRQRWASLFNVPDEMDVSHLIPIWRERLVSISWFMRCINEPLARRANKEDECSGRFWEGRFRLQALLDDTALYRCMVYVDLNPIRAGIVAVPEKSQHTSIKARIERRDSHLLAFNGDSKVEEPLPLLFRDYLSLVDWTGRSLRSDKPGSICRGQPDILDRLGFGGPEWVREIRYYGKWYYRAVGSFGALQEYCTRLGQHWLKGMTPVRPKPA